MSNEAGTRVTINGEPTAFLHWGRAGEIRLVLPPDLATSETGDIKVDFAETAPRTVDAISQDGDVIIALPARGPYIVNANTGAERGDTVMRVPQTTNRERPAAVVTVRSETGDVIIDDLR